MEKKVPVAPQTEVEEHVLDASGHLHVTDAPIDLSHYSIEAWIAFAFFWVLAADIFYQFFTRYALNSSASWTEEIARYLLICVVFIALAWAVRDNRHIHVDIVYRLLPAPVCRGLATLVDVLRIAFFAYAVLLTWQMMHRMGSGIDSFPLLAVPFLIMAGNLMNNAGITNRIYDFALALVGWLKGGLGHVNIIGSVVFAGMSGTAIADAAGLGTIEIKAMR